jgi:hypothetical protein
MDNLPSRPLSAQPWEEVMLPSPLGVYWWAELVRLD